MPDPNNSLTTSANVVVTFCLSSSGVCYIRHETQWSVVNWPADYKVLVEHHCCYDKLSMWVLCFKLEFEDTQMSASRKACTFFQAVPPNRNSVNTLHCTKPSERMQYKGELTFAARQTNIDKYMTHQAYDKPMHDTRGLQMCARANGSRALPCSRLLQQAVDISSCDDMLYILLIAAPQALPKTDYHGWTTSKLYTTS